MSARGTVGRDGRATKTAAGGGGRGRSGGSREALNRGLAKGIADRKRLQAEGMKAAREWRDRFHPPCPNCGHRLPAEIFFGEPDR